LHNLTPTPKVSGFREDQAAFENWAVVHFWQIGLSSWVLHRLRRVVALLVGDLRAHLEEWVFAIFLVCERLDRLNYIFIVFKCSVLDNRWSLVKSLKLSFLPLKNPIIETIFQFRIFYDQISILPALH
jgi:hypothetical protein